MQLYQPPTTITLDTLEDELTRAFTCMRDAAQDGETIVVALDDQDIQGVGDIAAAALAHGLLGLARALAVEGRKTGWQVNALSSTADTPPEERVRWIEHLAYPGAANGELVRLGASHLGTVPT
jgi:NAD(P)-dependent dehydrogenase (short-subunit alcohol dehydrogenase family)